MGRNVASVEGPIAFCDAPNAPIFRTAICSSYGIFVGCAIVAVATVIAAVAVALFHRMLFCW